MKSTLQGAATASVTENGRPLVVYHGTTLSVEQVQRTGFFFAVNKSFAFSFAGPVRGLE